MRAGDGEARASTADDITMRTALRAIARVGQLTVIKGCMFSGKTDLLIRRIAAARAAGIPCAVLKPQIDGRYAERDLVSHDGARVRADWVGRTLSEAPVTLIGPAREVFVEEGQFWPDLAAFVAAQLRLRNVCVAGLDATFRGTPFEAPLSDVNALVADEVLVPDRAVCACGAPARFSQRTAAAGGSQLLVGGREAYRPACRACFTAVPPLAR